MAEEIRDLIEKIQKEGVHAAEEKAGKIEEEAARRAKDIINNAKDEASKIIEAAKYSAARAEESGRASLKQASRDIVLSLRKEINATLDRLVLKHVHKALTPGEMAGIIYALVKERGAEGKSGVIISARKEEADKIEKALFAELSEEMKKGITVKPSEDIRGGFTISYDDGKSYYDFTDKALAEYIGAYLRPKLAGILKEA